MATEHTPPPWRVEWCCEEDYDSPAIWSWHPNEPIAFMADDDADTNHANGRLMSAAPELLEALETAVASGKSWKGITDARAAIAKARGE